MKIGLSTSDHIIFILEQRKSYEIAYEAKFELHKTIWEESMLS